MNMITKEKIFKLAQEHLQGTPHFLVDLTVSSDNQIMLYVDGDENIAIEDCVNLSRHVEFSLDRETEDFALKVSSAGIDMPLKLIRQYKKYIEKNLFIKLKTGDDFLGRLISVDEDKIEIIPLNENPNAKKGTPRKLIESEPKTLTLDQIEECKIEITF